MKLLVLPIVLFFTINLNAQQPLIAIKGAVTDTIAFTLLQAIDIAQPYDKIYLPGGSYHLTDSIQKPVHIIGTGYNDLIQRLLPISMFPNNLLIGSQAAGIVIEGIRFNTSIVVRADNVSIRKCQIIGSVLSNKSYLSVIQSYVSTYLEAGHFAIISNTVINHLRYTYNSTLKNSIFDYAIFSHNHGNASGYNIDLTRNINCIFQNCVIRLTRGDGPTGWSGNVVMNSLYPQNDATFYGYFVNSQNNIFNLASNLALASSAPIQNIGIYHGDYPWKNGGQPVNPHIEQNNSFLDVQNEQFKLKVKVLAQTN